MQASRAESRINKNNISSTSADTNQRQSHVWMSRKWHAWLKQTITLRRILNEYFNSKRKIPNKCVKPYDAITYSFCFATPLTVPEFGLKKPWTYSVCWWRKKKGTQNDFCGSTAYPSLPAELFLVSDCSRIRLKHCCWPDASSHCHNLHFLA